MRYLIGAALYGALSLIAFLAYALDKRAARHGERRIPERHLHLLALAGGWPGAWLAQQSLRHKTRKPGFQAVFFALAIANCLLVGLAVYFLA